MTLTLHIKSTRLWTPTGTTSYTLPYISSAAVLFCILRVMAAKKSSTYIELAFHTTPLHPEVLINNTPSLLSLCLASTDGQIRFVQAKPYGVYLGVSSLATNPKSNYWAACPLSILS